MRSLLVTGGGKGIGRSIAELASAQGYFVGVVDTDLEAAQSVVAELESAKAPFAKAYCADVCDADQVAAVVDKFCTDAGSLDVLVNNAGILRTGPLIDHSPEDFRLVMDVNLNAVFIVAQAAARKMRTAGQGVILNLSSINGTHPSPNCGAYAAAKGGVVALTQHMSLEWGAMGIRVNAIAPGFVDGGMSSPFYADPAVRKRRESAVPLGRLGSLEDIANAVLFLASEQASYISGQTLTVDGGVVNSVLLQLPRE